MIGTSEGGYVSQSVSYDARGTPRISGTTDNRLLWKGLMWESGPTELYYMRNRWYDPEAGRFMSEDPIGQAGGVNLYAFGENDPVNASDPSGLQRLSCTTQWVEFGSDNGTVTHAYSFVRCNQVGTGATGVSGLSGFGSATSRGGGGGVGLTGTRGDTGDHAVGVCRAAIGLTAASFFLESVGVAELYKGAKGLLGLRATARFAATFGSVPDAIQAYTRRRVRGAEIAMARNYASGWSQMSAISLGAEAAAGMEHTWWGYLPIPFASTAAAGIAASKACLSPGS